MKSTYMNKSKLLEGELRWGTEKIELCTPNLETFIQENEQVPLPTSDYHNNYLRDSGG